jgi:hypothetical protein
MRRGTVAVFGMRRMGMMQRMSRGMTLSGLVGLMLAGLTAAPAAAQEGSIFTSILGAVGIMEPEREEIEIRERPPLVVPPQMTLRTPKDPNRLAADPNWPRDPDVIERKRRAADARIPVTETERRRLEQDPRLNYQQMRAVRSAPGQQAANTPRGSVGDDNREELYWRPMEEGRRSAAAYRSRPEAQALAHGQEPARQALTDPPTGLRMPASTAPIPRNTRAEPVVRVDEADEKGFASRRR